MQEVGLGALELLTVPEVARLLKVSTATAWRRVHSGEIESMKTGGNRRVSPEALGAYQKRCTQQTAEQAGHQVAS